MRAISAALVLFSGCVLMTAAFAVDRRDGPSMGIGIIGGSLAVVGVLAWLVAFVRDGGRA